MASATGKRHRYRYYICSRRQRYGTTGCDAERIRADELEAAVFAALVDLYADPDLIRAATAAQRQQAADGTHKHEQELSAVEAELRRTDASVERYMLAFENGSVTEDMVRAAGPRTRQQG